MRRRRFLRNTFVAGAGVALGGMPVAMADGLTVGAQAAISADGVNVRGGPGRDQPLVGTLSSNARVDLLGASADATWWRVAGDALVGYVNAAFLQPTGLPASGDVVDVHLDVPYSPQLTDIWCDPADIEMWMQDRQGDAGGPSRAVQSAIWDWETGHNAGFSVDQWDCSPYAVASAAAHWMVGAGGFDHFLYDDAMAGSQVLAWQIANWREPSIALIWRGMHYVLVRGMRSLGERILGFYVADPDQSAGFWLGADRFVAIDRWLGEMFTPVSYLTPHTGVPGDIWQDRMVAIQRSWTSGPTDSGQVNATPASFNG